MKKLYSPLAKVFCNFKRVFYPKNFKTSFCIITFFLFTGNMVLSQAVFDTFGSGAWNNAGTWNVISGTDVDNIPDADDDVTINDGMTVTVSGGNQQVKNLTLDGIAGTRLNVNGSTLSIFGTLKGPSSNFQNTILQTDGTGLIKFEGDARALFSTWSAGSTTAAWLWRMEVALDSGKVGTAGLVRASYMNFTSGIYQGTEIRVDSAFNSDGTGVIVIGKDAVVRFSTAIGTRLVSFTPSFCRNLTVNGVLESTSQGYIAGQSVIINGKLIHRGFSAITSYPSGAGANEFVYGDKSAIEYSLNGDMNMGNEIDRSNANNPTPDTIIINVGNQFNTNATVSVINNDTIFCKNVRFGNYGKWRITNGAIILSPGAKVLNADASHFIITAGGSLTRLGVGATMVDFPVGPTINEYNPIRITNTGTQDNFSVRALNSRPVCLGPYPLTSINYQWDISEATPGGSVVSLELGYSDVTKRGSAYVPNQSYIVHCNGANADYKNGAGETGTGPFFVSGTNFTSFSLFGISSDPGVLPLSFMKNFETILKQDNVEIKWSVNCTSKSVVMDVEHSVDNPNNFHSIYEVQADAERCNKPFNFTHLGGAFSENFYRIKLTDLDGSISYSDIQHVIGNINKVSVKLSPNPVKGNTANLRIISPNSGSYLLFVSDAQGRKLKKEAFSIEKGVNYIQMDISNLSAGIYFLKTYSKDKLVHTSRLVKEQQ